MIGCFQTLLSLQPAPLHLGRCGNGPNCVLLPSELAVGHCNTAAHVARLIERQVVNGDGAEVIARTLQLKLDGNALMESGDPSSAEAAYSEAIDLLPARGAHMLHILYSNRSAARLAQVGRAVQVESVLTPHLHS